MLCLSSAPSSDTTIFTAGLMFTRVVIHVMVGNKAGFVEIKFNQNFCCHFGGGMTEDLIRVLYNFVFYYILDCEINKHNSDRYPIIVATIKYYIYIVYNI